MRTWIIVNGKPLGYIKRHGRGWRGRRMADKHGKQFDQATQAGAWVRS